MPNATPSMPSERAFGLLFAGLFLAAGLWPLIHAMPVRWVWLAAAAVLLLLSLVRPSWLRPLNYLWFRLGLLLHRIVSPVIMALMFFGVVTPIGLLMRAFGNDPLLLKPAPDAPTFWIRRETATTDMRLQS